MAGMDDRRVDGYEYDYRFSIDDIGIDDSDISDEEFQFCVSRRFNVYQFDIRTNFILKKIGGAVHTMCSERFRARLGMVRLGKELELEIQLIDRLKEYWMLVHEVKELVRKALDFADASTTTPRFVPVVVAIDVCTVQRDGEGVDEALDRAIRVENLVPLRLLDVRTTDCVGKQLYLMSHMPRARVRDASEWSATMEACPICLRELRIGDQVSVLRRCGHAFHYHCIATWLMRNNACPLCRCRFREENMCHCDSCCI